VTADQRIAQLEQWVSELEADRELLTARMTGIQGLSHVPTLLDNAALDDRLAELEAEVERLRTALNAIKSRVPLLRDLCDQIFDATLGRGSS
jgi:uncharacterized small protein (DUF1192 family)